MMGWFSWLYYMLLFLFISSSVSSSSISLCSPSPLCHIEESNALLQFKNSFSTDYAYSCDPPKTSSWKNNTDCCTWSGVTCNTITGHVVGLNLSSDMLGGIIHSNSTLFLLRYLQSLILSYNDFRGSTIPSELGKFVDLQLLEIKFANFSGDIPVEISYLSKLQTLVIQDSDKQLRLNTSTFKRIVTNLTNLQELSLYFVDMSHVEPTSLMNLSSSLTSLEIRYCGLRGNLPKIIFHLPISFSPSSSKNKLRVFDMFDNLLNGTLPNWLYCLPSLEFLDLGRNQFTGHIQEFQTTSLEFLSLWNNKLSGSIPILSIFQQVNLTWLELSDNSFSGFHVPIDLSLNTLSSFSSIYSKHSANQSILPNLKYLNLSHNHLTSIDQIPWKNLQFLDVRSNLLQGHLPIPPPSIRVFLASHNQLKGEVPSLICNLSSLQVLDLANNSLSGKLPPCIGNLSGNLSVLDLRKNMFHGTIPTTMFAKENRLKSLNLNGNELEGLVPQTLLNCEYLEFLDIGNNQISDAFPHWLESLPKLQVLILKSNKFYGSIANPMAGCPFSKLRILDISNNEFIGKLPTKYFESFTAMMKTNTSNLEYMGVEYYYRYSVSLEMKGISIELVKILTIFTTIDLSKNKFEGEIPELVGNLKLLKGLNLSHNKLVGGIPPSLGNLSGLEWLDLSSNLFGGGIPQQLTDITSLAVLNLSENKLAGPIPHGKQFDTFENTSYSENLGLCGLPLTKTCSNIDEAQQEGDDYEQTDSFDLWKIILMGYGCGIVIGISMGYIVLSDRRIALFRVKLRGERWI